MISFTTRLAAIDGVTVASCIGCASLCYSIDITPNRRGCFHRGKSHYYVKDPVLNQTVRAITSPVDYRKGTATFEAKCRKTCGRLSDD